MYNCGQGGVVVSVLALQAGDRGSKPHLDRKNFQTIIKPGSLSTFPALNIHKRRR